VDDGEVRIVGRKEVLEQAVLATRQAEAGVHSFGTELATPAGLEPATLGLGIIHYHPTHSSAFLLRTLTDLI
jgi:hypothetical protein